MLDEKIVEILKSKKSLLAFSYGVDSTALFYLMLENNINFDIAFINYNTRKNSPAEEKATLNLAKKFDKLAHIKRVKMDLNTPNFEKIARDLRYEFFNEICLKFGYEILITAHQLNDLFEWFLMRISKGSGLVNAVGMDIFEKKQNYILIRPLLYTARFEIEKYLKDNKIKHFIDDSNFNIKFQRNYIRQNFSDEFIQKFAPGIKKSFEFFKKDRDILLGDFIFENKEIFVIKNSSNSINLIDKAAKILGVCMSQNQRKELEKDCVISSKISITHYQDKIFIAPYKTPIMNKKFKEICRIKKIPKLLRGYIYLNQNLLQLLF
ncbi:tRNA lysidine(34) synthetase TilS [Campylobacter sp. FMV-PI01]|uniref:tRNA(Ile)-lysidine synthase n=1 Tax=Campylobacter portucalensis TaxID=2608384 RepID=A0A6L5WIK6_9BACT|nr:tRNA lysidine(34) synthetase TilS [Campylobacter portucalensis]MSN95643.1 tRNA lysidine(34) synthetase TilS [Campylobacter portucalensis]